MVRHLLRLASGSCSHFSSILSIFSLQSSAHSTAAGDVAALLLRIVRDAATATAPTSNIRTKTTSDKGRRMGFIRGSPLRKSDTV
jgi:hypothetical protein